MCSCVRTQGLKASGAEDAGEAAELISQTYGVTSDGMDILAEWRSCFHQHSMLQRCYRTILLRGEVDKWKCVATFTRLPQWYDTPGFRSDPAEHYSTVAGSKNKAVPLD